METLVHHSINGPTVLSSVYRTLFRHPQCYHQLSEYIRKQQGCSLFLRTYCWVNSTPLCVMEFIDGSTLLQSVAQNLLVGQQCSSVPVPQSNSGPTVLISVLSLLMGQQCCTLFLSLLLRLQCCTLFLSLLLGQQFCTMSLVY